MFVLLPAIAMSVICVAQQDSRQSGVFVSQKPFTLSDKDNELISKLDAALPAKLGTQRFSDIQYLSDGLRVTGMLAVPGRPGTYPCIILNRGGNLEFGAWTHVSFAGLVGPLVDAGYVVIASQYRGNAGGEGKEEFGGADVDDVLNLIPLLSSVPQADTSRIGMYGGSRGGLMTYLALARTDRIKAAVVRAGASDMFDSLRERPDMEKVNAELIPNYATRKDEELRARSPVLWADKLNPKTPILLMQGTADWRVSPEQGFAMAEALYRAKHPFRLVMFEGASHQLPEFREELYRLTIDWFNTYLRDGKPWPSLEKHGD
jgi:dipeptidyl aminopeptidase/acylaminoacyl peptidase